MAVLITIEDGQPDYSSNGVAQVVLVDFDGLDPQTTYPEDIEQIMQQVAALPHDVPWRTDVIKRLAEIRKQCRLTLEGWPPDEIRGGHAGSPI